MNLNLNNSHYQPTKKELLDFLDWLLACNIIDCTEYNQIFNKSLPYVKEDD